MYSLTISRIHVPVSPIPPHARFPSWISTLGKVQKISTPVCQRQIEPEPSQTASLLLLLFQSLSPPFLPRLPFFPVIPLPHSTSSPLSPPPALLLVKGIIKRPLYHHIVNTFLDANQLFKSLYLNRAPPFLRSVSYLFSYCYCPKDIVL